MRSINNLNCVRRNLTNFPDAHVLEQNFMDKVRVQD